MTNQLFKLNTFVKKYSRQITLIENREKTVVDPQIFIDRCKQYEKVHFDLGTGDAKTIYKMAKENPKTLCVGLDSCPDAMGEISWKVTRKPSKGGGIKNLTLVHESVENMPNCFDNIADSITILYPWAKLLQDVTLPEPATIEKISRLGKNFASLEIVLNYYVFQNKDLRERLKLPDLNDQYIKNKIIPIYKQFFLKFNEKKVITGRSHEEQSRWGKHLSLGSQRELLKLKWTIERK